MTTKEQVLQNCTVDGTIVKLPNVQLERKLYQEVAKSLELIGGKWKGGKVFGFVFPHDPTDLLQQIANGEQRNLKKEFQFFATPADLAKELVELANIDNPDLLVLEPSGGQGAIIKEILNKEPGLIVHTYELMEINRTFLSKIKDCVILGDDFLDRNKRIGQGTHTSGGSHGDLKFDRIVANPPFSKNQDIDHIREMYFRLRKGGRLVSVSSKHWNHSENRKEKEFKQWLKEVKAEIHEVEPGAFKESGTMIGTYIIVIDKNSHDEEKPTVEKKSRQPKPSSTQGGKVNPIVEQLIREPINSDTILNMFS